MTIFCTHLFCSSSLEQQEKQELSSETKAPPPSGLESAQIVGTVGLNRTGHMSFLTGQGRTPKFAGQVLPDRTESGLIFLSILSNK